MKGPGGNFGDDPIGGTEPLFRPEKSCTCHMDGSFITNCPTHGRRMTLVREAERKVRVMSTAELEAFLRSVGPWEAT